jgi:hypothetical protein
MLDSSVTSFATFIDIIDDNFVEPFEFFTIDIINVSNDPSIIFPKKRIIVYIQDDDCEFNKNNKN